MKPSTKYWIGLNQVGRADSGPEIREMAVGDALRFIAKTVLDNPLHKRVDIVIARTFEECEQRLLNKSNSGVGSRSGGATDSLLAEFDSMLAAVDDQGN